MADSDPVSKKDLTDLEIRIDAKLDATLDRLTELVRDVETNLLTSFHGYGEGQAVRMHALEVGDSAVNQRSGAGGTCPDFGNSAPTLIIDAL
jgi:hypothetical protein